MKPIILNLEPNQYSEVAKEKLEQYFEYKEFDPLCHVSEQIDTASALITRLGFKVNSELIGQNSNLKYVLTATTGTDHIDEEYLEKLKIKIISLKGEIDFLKKVTPTAEHTWGLLLALCRNLKSAIKDVEEYNWNRDNHLGLQLFGKTIGIVGLGRLGLMVSNYATAFGMNVLYTDIHDKKVEHERLELLELMSRCDVISVHLPLDATTKKIINSNCFNVMKPGALLINTSRGEIIDEPALLKALKTGLLMGAGLDVLIDESNWHGVVPETNKIIRYAKKNHNLIVTPHIGGACPDAMRMTEEFIAEKLISLFFQCK